MTNTAHAPFPAPPSAPLTVDSPPPTEPDRAAPAKHWDALDGMRGIAALIVLFSHANGIGIMMLGLPDFGDLGKAGVVLFFLLSSFLLSSQFVSGRNDRFSRNGLSDYFFRRFIRIYPLYFVYLAFALLMTNLSPVLGANETLKLPFTIDIKGLAKQLALIEGRGVTWSIIVEFKFYFVLPVVMLSVAFMRHFHQGYTMLLLAAAVAAAYFLWPQAEAQTNDIHLRYYLPVFLVGTLLAVVSNNIKAPPFALQLIFESAGWVATGILLLNIPAFQAILFSSPFDPELARTRFFETSVLFSFVVAAAILGSGAIRSIFALRALRYVGKISFSLYLWHIVIIRALSAYLHKFPQSFETWFLHSPLNGWFLLALCIAVSHISFTLIEQPFMKVKSLRNLGTRGTKLKHS